MIRFILTVFLLSSAACLHQPSRHKRSWIIDSFTIEEGHPGPFPYKLGTIDVDRAYRVHFDLYGEGVDQDPKGVLSIDKETGIVYVHKPVDYEEKDVLNLKFEAKKTDTSLDTKLGVEITITDINDNPPHFQKSLYEITTQEETAQGSHLTTVLANDRDKRGSPNSTFHYELKSVSPKTNNTQFFIDKESGEISFKGCMDHEVTDNYTLIVEAKDHGDVVSLSSSTTVVIHIQDGNNHLPTISGQTGSGKVKEGENGASPLRLHVIDRDSPNSAAWRARFTLHGEDARHFRIDTDPETNDGILTVITPLDYEEATKKELTISVDNEAPFFSCTVREKTASGLWRVDTVKADDASSGQLQSVQVTIEVEDVNDPPVFEETVKEAMLEESTPVGTWVEKVTAHDPDSSHASDFVYKVGDDPAGWVQVDPKTGDITTVKIPDREFPHVVNGIYTVLIHAVDNGQPPMTGTATVNIHVADTNDNVPQLEVDFVDMCVSDDVSTANITAFDPDADPFGGPFTFELLGDVQGKWRLDPSYGYSAGLVKEPGVYAGPHSVSLKVSDMQGQFGIYTLSVTVCDCSVTPNCRIRRENHTGASSGAIAVVLAALLLLLAGVLLAVLITCKGVKEFTPLQLEGSEGTLASDIEGLGTDCKVPLHVQGVSNDMNNQDPNSFKSQYDGAALLGISTNVNMEQNTVHKHFRSEHLSHQFHNAWNQGSNISGQIEGRHLYHQQQLGMSNVMYSTSSEGVWDDEALVALLQRRFSSLQETEDELLDYEPHVYSEEGDSDILSELDNISIPDNESLQNVPNNLSPEFNQLASICRAHQKC